MNIQQPEWKVRVEKPADYSKVKEVNDLAFGREGESNLIAAIRKSPSFVPALSLVAATEKEEILGHILFSIIYIKTELKSVESLALGPLAVKPKLQGIGIGSTLITEGLKRCRSLGFEHVILLGHSDYYPKFGFVPAINKGIHAPFEVPPETFMVYELKKNSLENIEGIVQYPEPFMSV